jgi:anti-anti-sigma factor
MKGTYSTKHCHVRQLDDAVVLRPHGDLMGGDETNELERMIEEFDAAGTRCMVIDLTAVSMMNSLAISRLIRGHVKFSNRKANLALCCLEARIQNIFVVTKLSLVMNVFPDERAALEAYRGA